MAELGVDFATLGVRLDPTLSFWADASGAERDPTLSLVGDAFAIDAHALAPALLAAAGDAGVSVKTEVGRIEVDLENASARWATGHAKADLIVLAAGRTALGGGRRDARDRLVGILAPHPGGASRMVVAAENDGWWFAAPSPGSGSVLAFMTDADLPPAGAKARAAWLAGKWRRSRICDEIGGAPDFHLARTTPAATATSTVQHGRRWIAVGDAASSLDPLCGFGIAAAMSKGAAIGRLISNGPPESAFQRYAAAERETFEAFDAQRRRVYKEADVPHCQDFWRRRVGRYVEHECAE
jgi:flavin-dependent dehydrogenase